MGSHEERALSRDAPHTSPAVRSRLDSLTGMRFFAALFVVQHHLFNNALEPTNHIARLPAVDIIASIGYSGVTFFFCLSGFVLTWAWQPTTAPTTFARRRFARVAPLHFATWIVAFAVVRYVGESTSLPHALLSLPLLHAWSLNASFPFHHNGVTWSLSCELFFYAMFPLIITRLQHLGHRMLLRVGLFSLMFLAVLPVALRPFGDSGDHSTMQILYYFPAYRIGEFAIGVVAALLVRGGWQPRIKLSVATVWLVGIIVATAIANWQFGLSKHQFGLPRPIVDLMVLPGFLIWIVAAAISDINGHRSLLAKPTLVKLGTWSFALYLTHQLALRALVQFRGNSTPQGIATNIAIGAGVLALLVALAGIVYESIERPAERWLRPNTQ